MTFFLALLNFGFHGFIEFDDEGKSIEEVNSTVIIEGDDDSWGACPGPRVPARTRRRAHRAPVPGVCALLSPLGEDDHNTHHYNTTVFHRDLPEYHKSKIPEFTRHKGSVFRKLSILELSIFLLAGDFKKLAEHYVDYTESMTKDEIARMLEVRAKRKEMTYDEYEARLASGEVYNVAEAKALPASE